jgi:hypothetical protein
MLERLSAIIPGFVGGVSGVVVRFHRARQFHWHGRQVMLDRGSFEKQDIASSLL